MKHRVVKHIYESGETEEEEDHRSFMQPRTDRDVLWPNDDINELAFNKTLIVCHLIK